MFFICKIQSGPCVLFYTPSSPPLLLRLSPHPDLSCTPPLLTLLTLPSCLLPHPLLLALSPRSSVLGFPLSFLPPLLPVYHSSIHPHSRAPSFCYSPCISLLQRFQSLSPPLSQLGGVTMTAAAAKSSTSSLVWIKSCRDWRGRHTGRIWVSERFRYWAL